MCAGKPGSRPASAWRRSRWSAWSSCWPEVCWRGHLPAEKIRLPATGGQAEFSLRSDRLGHLSRDPRVPRAPLAAREERATRLIQVVLDILHVGVADLDRHLEEL